MDFSKYKIHIPKEGSAGALIQPGENTFPLDENEIYSYEEGIEIILKENRGLWPSDDIWGSTEARKFFKELGVNGY